MKRRAFLGLGAALALAACGKQPGLAGRLEGPDHGRGHRLLNGDFPEPAEQRTTGVLIVGGGIAGLSAAWWLQRHGYRDFRLLEGERDIGGNAGHAESPVTRYPLGAHYLPLPTREAVDLVALLTDLGVVTGRRADGSPIYDETALVAAPHERLHYLGRWQAGLEPRGPAAASAEFRRFHERIEKWKRVIGNDGRPAFATPSRFSSRDPRFLALDRITFADWLRQEGLRDPRLYWYGEYATRDDFGSLPAETSAWAGLHYFAGRSAWGPYEGDLVLTWPEGNGRLARKMAERLGDRVIRDAFAWRVREHGERVEVDVFDGAKSVRYRAAEVILAVPLHVRARLLKENSLAHERTPWLVANLHVESLPAGEGMEPCWDNVIYDSPSVGYIVATHQHLTQAAGGSVLTYYWPLTGRPAVEARRELLERPWSYWTPLIMADLRRVHPDIDAVTTRVDLWRWGHGMIKPRPGLLTGAGLARARAPRGRIHFAHSDLAGMSLFEEAHDYGVRAAEAALARLGGAGNRTG
jgi:glycine/D-amino acid oxidase-like deaminating enzyme